MSSSIDQQWSAVCDRFADQGYGALTPTERTWLNIRQLIDSVENGGAISYFYNSGADTVDDCLADLSSLGAAGAREQIARVVALFPNGVPVDINDRNDVINSWNDDDESHVDALLDEVDQVLMPLMPELERALHAHLVSSGIGR